MVGEPSKGRGGPAEARLPDTRWTAPGREALTLLRHRRGGPEGGGAPESAGRPVRAAHKQRRRSRSLTSPTGPISGKRAEQPTARRRRHERDSATGLLEVARGRPGHVASLAAPQGGNDLKAAARWLPTTGEDISGTDRDRGPARASRRPPGGPIASRPGPDAAAGKGDSQNLSPPAAGTRAGTARGLGRERNSPESPEGGAAPGGTAPPARSPLPPGRT